jgi:hypothetical protein
LQMIEISKLDSGSLRGQRVQREGALLREPTSVRMYVDIAWSREKDLKEFNYVMSGEDSAARVSLNHRQLSNSAVIDFTRATLVWTRSW